MKAQVEKMASARHRQRALRQKLYRRFTEAQLQELGRQATRGLGRKVERVMKEGV